MATKLYWKWIFENLKMGRMKNLGDLKLFKNRNFQKNVPIRVQETIFKLRVCRGGPREEWCLAEAWAPPLETDLSYFPSHHVTITVTKPKGLLITWWLYCRLRPLKGAIFVNALFRWPAASNSIWLIWLSHIGDNYILCYRACHLLNRTCDCSRIYQNHVIIFCTQNHGHICIIHHM